ncbi:MULTISPECIES: hypothetical protein [unclassified Kitasatospora]|uniref:hypothetical protein n=1 Tax=unclassified Kitasatospora TaxID=2633591 RepID=UPI002E380348|nr:hypothetical protein [Kitasatospora sp. NBC_01246]
MDPLQIVIVAVIAAAALFAVLAPRLRSHRLRARFGPEYDRTVLVHEGDVRAAEHDLTDRLALRRRVKTVPVEAADRDRYLAELRGLQALFVEDPRQSAVRTARLLDSLLTDMGYPGEGRPEVLSVDHAARLPAYRDARRALDNPGADSEELRCSVIAVRDLIVELLHEERTGALARH